MSVTVSLTENAVTVTTTANTVEVTAPGPQGIQGATGPAGADGDDGKTWYGGTSDPSSGTGVDGDWYLNRTSWHVWEKVSGTWTDRGTIAAGSKYLKFICSRSSGTDDGTFTSGAWRTRTLTTEVNDDTGSASLASNRFTLPAGTYVIRASAPAYRVHQHMAALFNYTDSSYTLYGTSEIASAVSDAFRDESLITRSFVVGKFTITAAKAFEIRHYCNTTRADDGFGPANGIGVNETYTVVELWKVA